jgi:hypothetical protein
MGTECTPLAMDSSVAISSYGRLRLDAVFWQIGTNISEETAASISNHLCGIPSFGKCSPTSGPFVATLISISQLMVNAVAHVSS